MPAFFRNLFGFDRAVKGVKAVIPAPGPILNANTIAAPPPPTQQTQSAGVKAGQQAAAKVKRKMVPPVIGPRDGTFSKQPVRGFNEPRTLIGSGY